MLFFALLYIYIYNYKYWENGVILSRNGIKALVKSNSSRELLNFIRNQFKIISEKEELQYKEEIPLDLPEHKEQFVSYAKLEKLDKLGRKTIFEGIPRHSYYIKDLLDGYIEHQKNTVKSKEYNNDLYSYWLSIEEDNRGIYMKDSTTNMFRDQDKKIRDGVEAGKYFWQYFIQALYR